MEKGKKVKKETARNSEPQVKTCPAHHLHHKSSTRRYLECNIINPKYPLKQNGRLICYFQDTGSTKPQIY